MYYQQAIDLLVMSRVLITQFNAELIFATGDAWFNLTRAKLRTINTRDRAIMLLKQGR